MDEDVSVGELARAVVALRQDIQSMSREINIRLDKVVSTEVYTLQAAYVDRRITDLAHDIVKEREVREALSRDLERYQLGEAERRERERQTRLYQAVLPSITALVATAIAIWGVINR